MKIRRPLSVRSSRVPGFSLPALGLCAVVTAACGGEPAAAPPAKAPVAIATEAPAPPADLTAVPEPSNLMVYARVAKPSAATGVVAGWLKTQLPGVAMPGSDVVTEIVAGESVGEIVDMDQPIDLAATVTLQMGRPTQAFAISAAVKDPAKAKATFSSGSMKLVPGENGLLRIDGLGEPDDGDEDDDEARTCALVPSYGAAPLRLVCAFGHNSLPTLAPYLSRTTPRLPSAADVHVEMRFRPVRTFLTENAKSLPFIMRTILSSARGSASGPPGSAATDLLTAAFTDFLDFARDIERADLDVKMSDASAEAKLTTKLTSTSSFFARVGLAHPERVDVAPPAFLRLPVDAEIATFHRGYDDADLTHPRELLAKAVGEELAKEGVPSADAKALTDALGKLLYASPMVYASGVDDAQVAKALAPPTKPASAKGAKDADAKPSEKPNDAAVVDALVGYHIVGVDEPIAAVTANAKALVAAVARPAIVKWLKQESGKSGPPTLKIGAVAASAKLPKETMHLELVVPRDVPTPVVLNAGIQPGGGKRPNVAAPSTAKAAAPTPLRLHVYIVPDGARTWLALGATDALVVSRVASVLSTAPDAGTLTKRPGLEVVRDAKSNGGGFFTLHGVLTSALTFQSLGDGGSSRAARTYAAMMGTQGKGETLLPILLNLTAAPGGAGGGSSALTVTVPRAAIEDMIQLGMRSGMRM